MELVTFSCRECVVYMIPPASTVGHRAELWDVENPLEVAGQKHHADSTTCVDSVSGLHYWPLQPAHNANWLFQEVTSSVVTCGDDCWIRLHAVVSGDQSVLFTGRTPLKRQI